MARQSRAPFGVHSVARLKSGPTAVLARIGGPTKVGPYCRRECRALLQQRRNKAYCVGSADCTRLSARRRYRLSYNPGPMTDLRRFVRQNAFLVAAVALPLVVIIFFLLAAAIPRWTVAPPAFDLVLRGTSYEQPAPRVSLE